MGRSTDQAAIDNDLQSYPPAYSTVRSDPNGAFTARWSQVARSGIAGFRLLVHRSRACGGHVYGENGNGNNYVLADSTNFLDGLLIF